MSESTATATVSECLQVHGSMTAAEIDDLTNHWAALDRRLRSFTPDQVAMALHVKDRDAVGQLLTLEAKIADWGTLVAKTSVSEFGQALDDLRDDMVRLIGDAIDTNWGHRKGGSRSER